MLILVLTSRSLDPLLAEGAVDCWRVNALEEGHVCPLVSSLQEGWLSCTPTLLQALAPAPSITPAQEFQHPPLVLRGVPPSVLPGSAPRLGDRSRYSCLLIP